MPEKSLALPLNGEEIIEAIVDKVRLSLRKDCFLNSTSAYDWFRAEIGIHLLMNDCGRRPEVTSKVIQEAGEIPVEQSNVKLGETNITIDQAPPNAVRVESNQAVPILSSDKEGRPEVRRVSYRGSKNA